MENPTRGEAFMKVVIKASLFGLFAIGVKSSDNIDKFINAFSVAFEKVLADMTGKPLVTPTTEPAAPLTPAINAATPLPAQPVSTVPAPVDLPKDPSASVDTLGINLVALSALEKAGVKTIEQLLLKMSQDDLTKIKGIGKKSAEEILSKVSIWNKQSA